MTDIELIIKIPEEMYKNIQNRDWRKDDRKWFSEEWRAIRNGTPLPKGHGRLIDADEYLRKICTYKDTGCGSCNFQCECIADEPTIIEADEESDTDV